MQIRLTKINKVRVVLISRKEETTPTRIANELIHLAYKTFFDGANRKSLALSVDDLTDAMERETHASLHGIAHPRVLGNEPCKP